MDCLVINMAKDTDRWQHVHAALVQEGIPHRRFNAVDGRRVTTEYDDLLGAGTKAVTPKAVLGCALSHYLALGELYASGGPLGLVLEDDVIVAPGAADRLAQLLRTATFPWDVLKLDYFPAWLFHSTARFQPMPFSGSTAAYVITREAARTVLGHKLRWPTHADVVGNFLGLRIYAVNRAYPTFHQTTDSATSTIQANRYPGNTFTNSPLLRLGPMELVNGDIGLLFVGLVVVRVLAQRV